MSDLENLNNSSSMLSYDRCTLISKTNCIVKRMFMKKELKYSLIFKLVSCEDLK